MKKLIALALALVLCLGCVSAFAEALEVDVENAFDGVWVQFADFGFQIYLPSDWIEWELTEDELAEGMFYSAVSEEGYGVDLYYGDASAAAGVDHATFAAGVAETYPDAELITINGIDFVEYTDQEIGTCNLYAFGADDDGYIFEFYPYDDADFLAGYALPIAASISNLE